MNNAQALKAAHSTMPASAASSAEPSSAASSVSGTPTTSSLATSLEGLSAPTLKPEREHLDFHSESAFPSLGAAPSGSGLNSAGNTWKGKRPAGQWSSAASTRQVSQPQANGTQPALATPPRSVSGAAAAFTETLVIPTAAIALQHPRTQAGTRQPATSPSSLGEVLGLVMKIVPGVRIEASSSQKTNVTTFLFRGPSEAAVRKAYKEVVQRAVKKSSITVDVPSFTRPYIIGVGGRTLKSITEATNTSVQMPPREEGEAFAPQQQRDDVVDETPITLTITGDPEGCEQARTRILAIVAERAVKATRRINTTEIPREFWPLISGVKQARLTEILAAAGLDDSVSATIPTRRALRNADGSLATSSNIDGNDDDAVEQRQPEVDIVLTGSKESIDAAVEAVFAEYEELKRVTRPMTISLPKRQHRFLIGQHADDILLATGSAVIVPFQDDPSESVLILGRKEAVGMAVNMVMTKTESAEVDVVDLATAHKGAHDALKYAQDVARYLMARGKLRAIQDEGSVQVFVPRVTAIAGGNTAIEVVGKREQVDAARAAVADLVRRIPPHAVSTIEVDPLLHKHLIGKKGARLKQFEASKGVEVVFPRESEERSDVLLVYAGDLTAAATVRSSLDDVATEILQHAKEAADIRSATLNVPVKHHGQIIGQNGSTLNAVLGEERMVVVKLGGDSGSEDVIVLRGPSNEVARVEREILRIAEDAKNHEIINSYVTEFDIDAKTVSHIVGRGGASISKLRDELAVKIDFTDQNDAKRKKLAHVIIRGRRENVEEAKKRIASQAERLADETILSIALPPGMDRGSLIGKQGAYVQRLETKYEVRINFPKNARAVNGDDAASDASSSVLESISIRGPKKGAEAAKKELLELIDYEREHGDSVTFEISSRALPRLFGRNGVYVRELAEETGTNIDVGRSDGGSAVPVTLKGTKAATSNAKKRILAISKEIEDETVMEVQIDRSLHITLIGKGGQNIRDMVVRCGGPDDSKAQGNVVRFPRHQEDSDVVTLRGSDDLVRKLRIELEAAANELRDRTVYGVIIPQASHASIIGRGGAGINQINQKHGVKTVFPGWKEHDQAGDPSNFTDLDTANLDDLVKLLGPRAKCEAAAQDLLSRSQSSGSRRSGPAQTLKVPHHLHARVAEGGRMARFAREHNVRIDHAGSRAPSTFPMPSRTPRPPANGTMRRIDDVAQDDFDADDDDDDDDAFYWDLIELGTESLTGEGEEDVPWQLSGSAESVAKVEAQILDRMKAAQAATHAAYLQVTPGMMPRLVGRGGSGLERLRSSGVTADVLGRQNADTLIFTGTLAQLDDAKMEARLMCRR